MAAALQQLATSLNLPAGCHLVVTAHDELSFDVIFIATTQVFGTFIPNPYSGPKPDMDTLVTNAESTWEIGDGRAAVVECTLFFSASLTLSVDSTASVLGPAKAPALQGPEAGRLAR